MNVEDKITKLNEELIRKGSVPKNLRVLLIDENRVLRAHDPYFRSEWNYEAFAFIDAVKCDRGSMLDAFARIEFMVKELMLLKLLGSSYPQGAELLDDIIDPMTHRKRIDILKRWQVIDKELAKILGNLNNVRNDIAHSWALDEVRYNNQPIKEEQTFLEFKTYLKEGWQKLIAVYKREESVIDIQKVIERATW